MNLHQNLMQQIKAISFLYRFLERMYVG